MANEQTSIDRTYLRYRWQIFAVTWLAYAGFYLTRKSFSVAKIALSPDRAMEFFITSKEMAWINLEVAFNPVRSTDFFITSSQMAWIDSAYLIAYAIGQFVWGMAGDRFGTRKVILVGMLSSVLMGFSMGASSLVMLFGIFFCIQGLCQSSGWAPLSKNISNFFSQRERGKIMGMWCTNYALVCFIASTFAGFVALQYGNWRYAFYFPAIALFIIWLLFYFLQRNRPEDLGLPSIEAYHGEEEAGNDPDGTEDTEESSWVVIKEVFQNRMVLLLGSVYFFLKPTRYAILFWGPLYINERTGANILKSGLMSSMFELAGPFSVFLGGYISDKYFRSKRMPVSIICLFGLAGLLFIMDKLPPGIEILGTQFSESALLGICFFFVGFLLYAPDSLVSGTAAIDFGTKRGASTAAGFINGSGSIGAIVGGTIPGFLKNTWGWNGIFVLLSCSVLLAALLLLPQWHTLPTPEKEPKPA